MKETLDLWLETQTNPEELLAMNLRNARVTFSDNMDEPIHRWFRFPAGFSARFAQMFLKLFTPSNDSLVLDPFTGCGTTNVVAKTLKIQSIGVEKHPFLAWVAKIKVRDYNIKEELKVCIDKVLSDVRRKLSNVNINDFDIESKPELLHKCYSKQILCELYAIKQYIEETFNDNEVRDFFMLALICILRKVTTVDVGWPYILPKKKKKKRLVPVYDAFKEQLLMMWQDLRTVNYDPKVQADIYEADARAMSFIDDNSIGVAFTSPPYLNNYDYADRTRLELYFLGWASSWREITEKIRKKLIVSCSHQAKEVGLKEGLLPDKKVDSEVREKLIEASKQLRSIKRSKGGKKDYDIMVVAYFNDMLKAMEEVYRVLKDGAYFGMVLGDSAPYGVHIPTDEFLAKIGKSIGFREAKIFVLRDRGTKWTYVAKSGRRHSVKLRESLVLFRK